MAEESVRIGSEQLTLMRVMRVCWASVEVGAPYVMLAEQDADEVQVARAVRSILQRPQLEQSSAVEVYRGAFEAVPAYAALAELAPGSYSIAVRFDDEESAQQPFLADQLVQRDGGRAIVTVTDESLALLRGSSIVFADDGGAAVMAGVDPKYPYRSSSHFYDDMAKLLKLVPVGPHEDDDDPTSPRELSQAQIDRLDRLHYLSQPVLQALLEHGQLAPGRFVRDPPGWGVWKRCPITTAN